MVRNRIPLKRCTKGILVILEKSPRNINIQKLREILLLEADFNMLHKIVFNGRRMPSLEDIGVIFYETIGRKRTQ